jgi:hypothetical protein
MHLRVDRFSEVLRQPVGQNSKIGPRYYRQGRHPAVPAGDLSSAPW